MNWQVQSLDFPEYQLRAPWTSAINNMHRHTHFPLRCCRWLCGCHCSVRFRCVIQMISLHRFHLFCNPTCFSFYIFWDLQSGRMDVAEQDLSLYAEEVLTGKLIFSLIRWEYFVCVCFARPLLFLCVLRGCCSVEAPFWYCQRFLFFSYASLVIWESGDMFCAVTVMNFQQFPYPFW